MKALARLTLFVLAVTLTAGPALAAPVSLTVQPRLTSPSHASPRAGVLELLGELAGVAAIGGILVKDTGAIAKKFVTRASQAAGDYKDGVAGAGGRFEAAALANEGNFEQGVQAAITRKAYGKGVRGSGSKFEKNATTLGATRYGPGVQNAQDAYAQGVSPYLDKLKSLDLPPKGPRRSPQNQQRSVAVQMALGALKEGK